MRLPGTKDGETQLICGLSQPRIVACRATVAIAVHPVQYVYCDARYQTRSHSDAVLRSYLSFVDAVRAPCRRAGAAAGASPGAAARPACSWPRPARTASTGAAAGAAWTSPAAAGSPAGSAQALQAGCGDAATTLRRPELRGVPQTARRH